MSNVYFSALPVSYVKDGYTLKQRERTNLIQSVSSSTQVFFGHLVATSLLMAEQKTMLSSLLKSRRLELDMDLCHQLVRHSSPSCFSGSLAQFLSPLLSSPSPWSSFAQFLSSSSLAFFTPGPWCSLAQFFSLLVLYFHFFWPGPLSFSSSVLDLSSNIIFPLSWFLISVKRIWSLLFAPGSLNLILVRKTIKLKG